MKVDLSPLQEFEYNQMDNYDFCFAMLGDNNQILHTPCQCKDYIQDIFWIEFNKVSGVEIYSMIWEVGMLNLDTETFKLAIFGGEEVLEDKAQRIQEFINFFDNGQGFPLTIVHTTDDEKILVVEFSREWATSGPMISALTSIIRISGAYKNGDPLEYLKDLQKKYNPPKELSPAYLTVDAGRLDMTIRKFSALLKGMKVDANWETHSDVENVHDYGICYFNGFPQADV